MKNKSFQKSVSSVQSEKDAPAASDAAQKTPEFPVLTVPECDSSGELTQFCDALIATLASGPKQLVLRFVGPHNSRSDSALVLYDILAAQRNGVTVITEAWSPVIGPSILTWLAGDVRRIRNTTYLHFRSAQDIFSRKNRCFPWEDDIDLFGEKAESEINLAEQDYNTVLRLIDEYFSVEQMAGKIITPDMLKEFGLLEKSPLDNFLRNCWSKGATSVPTTSEKDETGN